MKCTVHFSESLHVCFCDQWTVHVLCLLCPNKVNYTTVLLRSNLSMTEHQGTSQNTQCWLWWAVYNEQKNQWRTMAIMFPASEYIWLYLWSNMNQMVYINNKHFTAHTLECYSRNHKLWLSICHTISYISVKCAWMLEDTILTTPLISGKQSGSTEYIHQA